MRGTYLALLDLEVDALRAIVALHVEAYGVVNENNQSILPIWLSNRTMCSAYVRLIFVASTRNTTGEVAVEVVQKFGHAGSPYTIICHTTKPKSMRINSVHYQHGPTHLRGNEQ